MKKFNDGYYKLTLHRCLRNKGVEGDEIHSLRGSVNDEKLAGNLARARSKVIEYGLCNPWQHFVTLTIDPKKYDRFDLRTYYRDFSQFLRDYRKKGADIRYLFIPERHKDGSWHMHGLLMGLPDDHLTINTNGYYDWKPYSDRFGFMSIDIIKDSDAVAHYIAKYVSKDLANGVTEFNAKSYYCSRGLKKARVIKMGSIAATTEPDYANDYCQVWKFDDLESALSFFDA